MGSMILRDVRMWHAAVGNTSDVTRTMIGVGYAPAWYNGFVIPMAEEVEARMQQLGIPFATSGAGGEAYIQQGMSSSRQTD